MPWKGYFDLIGLSDAFVLLDDVQYTRRDWRNRNRIKTPRGPAWLTIAVKVKGRYHQRIDEVEVEDRGWAAEHWRTLAHNYARAPHYPAVRDRIESLYAEVTSERLLTRINERLLRGLAELLGIRTPVLRSTEVLPAARDLEATDRLVALCEELGATSYLSGPAARDYLDEERFAGAGIAVEWMDYSGYPEYPQLHPPFEHRVSVLDLLFNTGADAPRYLKSASAAAAGA